MLNLLTECKPPQNIYSGNCSNELWNIQVSGKREHFIFPLSFAQEMSVCGRSEEGRRDEESSVLPLGQIRKKGSLEPIGTENPPHCSIIKSLTGLGAAIVCAVLPREFDEKRFSKDLYYTPPAYTFIYLSHDFHGDLDVLLPEEETHNERTNFWEEDHQHFNRSSRFYELPSSIQRFSNAARVLGDRHGLLQWTNNTQPTRVLPDSVVFAAYEPILSPIQSKRNGGCRSVPHQIRIPLLEFLPAIRTL